MRVTIPERKEHAIDRFRREPEFREVVIVASNAYGCEPADILDSSLAREVRVPDEVLGIIS